MKTYVLAAAIMALCPIASLAEEGGGHGAPKAKAAEEEPAAMKPPLPKADYCANFADAAAEARIAWQKRELLDLEQRLDAQIKVLDAKRAEYLAWRKERDDELKKAGEGLVAIYAKMRPDAAAAKLQLLDIKTAAAILRQLNARSASAILNDMPPAPAAELTKLLAAAGPEKPKPVSQ